MKTPHKHADLIKAWADGAEIEYWQPVMRQWLTNSTPKWYEDTLYRIKPEPKPDAVKLLRAELHHGFPHIYMVDMATNLKLTFDYETGKLKAAEVIA